MNEDSKDENLTQSPASQSGFVADYTQGEQVGASADAQSEQIPAQDEPSEAPLEDQSDLTQPQQIPADSPVTPTSDVGVAPQEDISTTESEPLAPAEVSQSDPAPIAPIEPVMEEVPGIDVSAGEAEIDAGVGVNEVEVIEPIDDTLDALSGDL